MMTLGQAARYFGVAVVAGALPVVIQAAADTLAASGWTQTAAGALAGAALGAVLYALKPPAKPAVESDKTKSEVK